MEKVPGRQVAGVQRSFDDLTFVGDWIYSTSFKAEFTKFPDSKSLVRTRKWQRTFVFSLNNIDLATIHGLVSKAT